jgi:hypothetical protein
MQTRWQRLFADLEAQAVAAESTELAIEVSDRTRGEVARIGLTNRLRANVGHRVDLRAQGAAPVVGTLMRVGADWALLATPNETIVMLDALIAAVDLPPSALSESGVDLVTSRVGLGVVWRAIARDRTPVRIQLRDGSVVTGTPDRVGADFVDLACHEFDEAPRGREVKTRWALTWTAISVVTRREPTLA